MRRSVLLAVALLLAALAAACANKSPAPGPAKTGGAAPGEGVQQLRVQVVNSFPHDRASYTQGLVYAEGKLYESAGQYGQSSLRRVDLDSGRVEKLVPLPASVFAEGLARVGDELIQLSWKEERAFVWRLATFEPVREHSYRGEGWGLTLDPVGQRLVMSSGSSRLEFRDPKTFAVTGSVDVTRHGVPVANLNELEWWDGQVYANIWQTDLIVRINPASGAVTAVIEATDLLTRDERVGAEVLNGIAVVPERGTFFITGKLWPRLFEVRFVP